MENKFYIVEAKCGHVGRNNYIVKSFATMPMSPSEAAQKTRQFGRVKHHWKDAIVSVRECTEEEYLAQVAANSSDPYFAARSIQEQRMTCGDVSESIIRASSESLGKRWGRRETQSKYDRWARREEVRAIHKYKMMRSYAYAY